MHWKKMSHDNDNSQRDEYDEVLGELGKLATAIDRQSYPGVAWTGPPRRARKIVLSLAVAASAVAAAVALAAGLGWLLSDAVVLPTTIGRDAQSVVAIAEDNTREKIEDDSQWQIPSVDVSLAGGVDFEIPGVSISSIGGGDFEWEIPSLNQPSLENGSDNHETQEDNPDTVGRSGSRRSYHTASAGLLGRGPTWEPQRTRDEAATT